MGGAQRVRLHFFSIHLASVGEGLRSSIYTTMVIRAGESFELIDSVYMWLSLACYFFFWCLKDLNLICGTTLLPAWVANVARIPQQGVPRRVAQSVAPWLGSPTRTEATLHLRLELELVLVLDLFHSTCCNGSLSIRRAPFLQPRRSPVCCCFRRFSVRPKKLPRAN